MIAYSMLWCPNGHEFLSTSLKRSYDPLECHGLPCINSNPESRLEGVNRRNLKFINFEQALFPGLVFEIFQSAEDSSPCYELLNKCG
jgi:hypothetical protein